MLCLSCFRWTASGSLFCSGCGRSFGARYCGSKKRHANVMNAQFCAHCGSQKLTDAALYLPLGFFVRVVILVALILVARSAWASILPFAEREANALLIALCPAFNSLLNWSVCVAFFYWLTWFLASLLPAEVGKPIQNTLRSGLGILLKIIKTGSNALFRVIGRLLFGSKKPHST